MQPSLYEASHVKQLSANSWEVDVDVELVERADNMIVKDVTIRYPLRVVRRDVSRAANPYGLVVDGFVKVPKRVKQ